MAGLNLMGRVANLGFRGRLFLIFGAFLFLGVCVAVCALVSAGAGARGFARAAAGPAEQLMFAADAAAKLRDIRSNYADLCGAASAEDAERRFALCGGSNNALLRALDRWQDNLENSRALPERDRRRHLEVIDSARTGLSGFMVCVTETYAEIAEADSAGAERGGRELLARFAACADAGERVAGLIAADRGAAEMLIGNMSAAARGSARRSALTAIAVVAAMLALSLAKDAALLRVLTRHVLEAGDSTDTDAAARTPQGGQAAAADRPAANVPDADKPKLLALVEDIRRMLEDGDLDCRELAGGLARIPSSGKLIAQIDEYDFGPALETLSEIKRELEA